MAQPIMSSYPLPFSMLSPGGINHNINDCGEYITMKTKSIHGTQTPGHLGFHALCSLFWNRATDINCYVSYNTRETLIIRQSWNKVQIPTVLFTVTKNLVPGST